jgi:hypothetical protein
MVLIVISTAIWAVFLCCALNFSASALPSSTPGWMCSNEYVRYRSAGSPLGPSEMMLEIIE